MSVAQLLSIDALQLIAEGLALTVDAHPASGLCPSPREGRSYVQLVETEEYDAWLIAWGPTGALDLHDHGGSHGVVHVVRGELFETYVDRDDPHPLRTRAAGAGDVFVVPAHRVHEVWNPGAIDALSIHVYSPPLGLMTFYEQDDAGRLSPAT